MIELIGQLICANRDEAEIVRRHLPEHVRLTRQEPGCRLFEVTECGPLSWRVHEQFDDRAAYEAHQARTRDSDWGRATAGLRRDYELRKL